MNQFTKFVEMDVHKIRFRVHWRPMSGAASPYISKGASLASDTIVRADLFVNDVFGKRGTLSTDSLVKIPKKGITWNRSRKEQFTAEDLGAWRLPSPSSKSAFEDDE